MPTIRMRQRTIDETPPTALAAGEIAFYLGTGALKMWVGDAAGTPVQFGTGVGGFVRLSGDTMTGPLNLSHLTPSLTFIETDAGVDMGRWRTRVSGGSMVTTPLLDTGGYATGGLTLSRDAAGIADMTVTFNAATTGTLPSAASLVTRTRGDARYLQLAGGAMTGFLTLHAKPTAALHAATKGYIDDILALYIPGTEVSNLYVAKAGSTMTGALVLPATNPTSDNQATRKAYVDAQVATKQSPAEADAKYATKVHTHVEVDITNLDRLRWRGTWVSGSYAKNDVVQQNGVAYVATVATSAVPPSANWAILGTQGAAVHVGDAAPANPFAGDLWYKTSPTIGLYVRFNDGNSTQWVSTDQASMLAEGFVKKVGDSMSGQLSLLAGNPTASSHAANKAYVDSVALTRLTQDQADALYAPASSDSRLKKFAQPMPDGMEKILQLRPVTFEWKTNDRPHMVPGVVYGLIAQEVAAVLPTSVYTTGATLSIDALSLIGTLVGAVQQLDRRLKEIENG